MGRFCQESLECFLFVFFAGVEHLFEINNRRKRETVLSDKTEMPQYGNRGEFVLVTLYTTL